MAQIEHLIPTEQLKTNLLAQLVKSGDHSLIVSYDSLFDALFVRVVPRDVEVVVHYLDDHVGLLYQPESLEIVGLQVEDFQHSFLPEPLEHDRVWRLSEAGARVHDNADLILAIHTDSSEATPIEFADEHGKNRYQYILQVNWPASQSQLGPQGIVRLLKVPSKS